MSTKTENINTKADSTNAEIYRVRIKVDFGIHAFDFTSSFTLIMPEFVWFALSQSERAARIYEAITETLVCEYREVDIPNEPLRIIVVLKIPDLGIEEEREWNIPNEDWQDLDDTERKTKLYAAILETLSWSYTTCA